MELSNVTTFLQDLEEIQELMKCQACNNPDKTLGRIKICGHYSCKTCLKKSDTSCPKCKIFCTNADIAWKNIFTESESIIFNLKDLLLQAVKRAEPKKNGNTFEYLNKTYQINFIDDQRVNTKGETPLHVACKRKNVKDVKNLIKKQSDLNAQDFAGWVPLVSFLITNAIYTIFTLFFVLNNFPPFHYLLRFILITFTSLLLC